MSKLSPFERIISLIDRKKIFQNLLLKKQPVVLKFADQKMIYFKSKTFTAEGHLDGMFLGSTKANFKQRQVFVLFYVGADRYFLHTKLTKTSGNLWRLHNTTQFYRLNRRETHRTLIPAESKVSMLITRVGGMTCQVQVKLADFSTGGVKFRWVSGLQLFHGMPIRATILWFKGKEFPVQGVIKHGPRDQMYGMEFTALDKLQVNRLRFLSIELQQLY